MNILDSPSHLNKIKVEMGLKRGLPNTVPYSKISAFLRRVRAVIPNLCPNKQTEEAVYARALKATKGSGINALIQMTPEDVVTSFLPKHKDNG